MARAKAKSKSKSKSPARQAKHEEHEADELVSDSDVPEDEYEIDEILDDEYGIFDGAPNERCFFVSWKGYDESENCWISEADAGNARELIESYTKRLKAQGKTMKAKPGSKAAPRKSDTGKGKKREASTPVQSATTSKRARATTTTATKRATNLTPAQQRKEEKRLSKDAASASLSRLQGSSHIIVDGEEVEDAEVDRADDDPRERSRKQRAREVLQYESRADWEGVVENIETIEQTASGGLAVFVKFVNGERHAYDNHVVKERCPLKVIEFYESRLRFRPLPGEAAPTAEGASQSEKKVDGVENGQAEDGHAAEEVNKKSPAQPQDDEDDVQIVEAKEVARKETSPQPQPQPSSSSNANESQMDIDHEEEHAAVGGEAEAAAPIATTAAAETSPGVELVAAGSGPAAPAEEPKTAGEAQSVTENALNGSVTVAGAGEGGPDAAPAPVVEAKVGEVAPAASVEVQPAFSAAAAVETTSGAGDGAA